MYRRYFAVATPFISLALGGCSDASEGVDVTNAVPAEDAALVTDDALDQAMQLQVRPPSAGAVESYDLVDPRLFAKAPTRLTLTEGVSSGATTLLQAQMSKAARPPDADGYLAYIQGTPHRHEIRLAPVKDPQGGGKLVYRGDREIQSVAVSVDGKLVTFSTRSEDGDFDVFLLDVDGSLFGTEGTVVQLPSTSFDEVDVSMSLDGLTHAWQSFNEGSGTTNYIVARLDRETTQLEVSPFDISFGGAPIEQLQPVLSGSGDDVFFIADDDFIRSIFDAPIIVRFSTIGTGGAITYVGLAGETDAVADLSATFDADRILFRETLSGVDSLVTLDLRAGEFVELLENTTIEAPYMTADGGSLALVDGGSIFTATLDLEAGAVVDATQIPSARPHVVSLSPYWAKELPPPPPPPPGQIAYEGSTIGAATFQRPDGIGPLLIAGDVAFHAFEFSVETGGFYDVFSRQDYDGYLHLYEGSFDPLDPATNVIAANDDLIVGHLLSGLALALEPGDDYILVTSAFLPGDEGTFTNTITPRPIPGPGEVPVIEILTESVRVAAPGEAIEYGFVVSSTDPITCSIDFGDGTVQAVDPCEPGSRTTVSHAFDDTGHYTVALTVGNAAGSDSARAFPTIAIDDPDAFDVVVVFANDGLSPSQQLAFDTAAARWGQVIVGDLVPVPVGDVTLPRDFSCAGEPPFNGFIDDLVISASGEAIDGAGAVLGSAGPCRLRGPGSNGPLLPLPVYGAMRFDVADLDELEVTGDLESVILHEMGHVLGLGTLWEGNGFLTGTIAEGANPQSPDYDPHYVATLGVAQYGELLTAAGLPVEPTVPVENTGGEGTHEGHWREVTFVDELMTGFLTGEAPLSILTIGGLLDVGYQAELTAADPYALLPTPPAMAQFASAPQRYDLVFTIEDLARTKSARPLLQP